MNIIKEPRVTLMSFPLFIEPAHLQVTHEEENLVRGVSHSSLLMEAAGRLCYMSHNNPAHKTVKTYIKNILEQAHGSVLEHANISLLIEGISRSCSHEIVRHRAGFAYSQLSQRYVDESDVDFVMPPAIMNLNLDHQEEWITSMRGCLYLYQHFADVLSDDSIVDKKERRKKAREAARSVLPNATETKMVMTGNVRAWRHFLQMRGSLGADAEIRRLALVILKIMKDVCPEGFQDMEMSTPIDSRSSHAPEYIISEYHKV